MTIDAMRKVLVIIDAWADGEDNPNRQALPEWQDRCNEHMDKILIPFVDWARDRGWIIAHVFKPLRSALEVRPGDIVIGEKEKIVGRFPAGSHVYFCGYALNECVLKKPMGIESARSEPWSLYLVSDCTMAISQQAEQEQAEFDRTIEHIRDFATIVTASSLMGAA